MKTNLLLFSFASMIIFIFSSCDSGPKGNPELVAQAEKVAELGCACQDVKCLYDIKVDGKGVAKIIMAKTDDLTKEEKEKFFAAARKYNDCERALSGKK